MPLRERIEDILPMAPWLLKQISIRGGCDQLTLPQEATDVLISYRWPGNVREPHNALERAATLAHTKAIMCDDLPDSIRHPASGIFVPTARGAIRLKDLKREHIARVLAGSPTLEAQRIEVDSRVRGCDHTYVVKAGAAKAR